MLAQVKLWVFFWGQCFGRIRDKNATLIRFVQGGYYTYSKRTVISPLDWGEKNPVTHLFAAKLSGSFTTDDVSAPFCETLGCPRKFVNG